MDIADQLTILGRSALAGALGILIGLEREKGHGVRPHTIRDPRITGFERAGGDRGLVIHW